MKNTKQYILRKSTGMKILRVIFWIMLVFVFFRGIITIFAPDKEEQATQMIADFKASYSNFTNQNAEVMSFAQNFVKEYLTYEVKGESDYKSRLKPYVSSNILSGNMNDFTAAAKVTYVEAYKIEDYSDHQVDVYVLAEVEYSSRILEDDGQTYTTKTTSKKLILNVPVYYQNGTYIVENLPLMVTDTMQAENYLAEDYYGTAIAEEKAEAVEISIDNFLKAYFEQDESVINYYLSSSADKNKFIGLHGRFTYCGIDAIRCYQDTGDIICLVEFRIQDTENGVKMLQKINLSVQESGGKFYIKSMDTRTGNLNISK